MLLAEKHIGVNISHGRTNQSASFQLERSWFPRLGFVFWVASLQQCQQQTHVMLAHGSYIHL